MNEAAKGLQVQYGSYKKVGEVVFVECAFWFDNGTRRQRVVRWLRDVVERACRIAEVQ